VRVTRFEQYEDTLENLALTPEHGESATLPFDDGPTALRWKLDEEARRVYCGIGRYRSPFGFTLRRAEGAGSAEKVAVDLVESLVWLLGLDVDRMWREAQGVAITGKNCRGESVLVAFRECDVKGSGDWVMRLMAEHAAERLYTNDPADLAFPGADRLEAIEAVFASQFGTA
jgi:adenine-specific DNA-methyltransferase